MDTEAGTLFGQLLPCVCCGYLVIEGPVGSYDICPICFWEDDEAQLALPLLVGGPNSTSLVTAQSNFITVGASTRRRTQFVRKPDTGDERAPLWRPLDLDKDRISTQHSPNDRPDDGSALYYWLPTYWIRENGTQPLTEQEWFWDLLDEVPELQSAYEYEVNAHRELRSREIVARFSEWALAEYSRAGLSSSLQRLLDFLDRTLPHSNAAVRSIVDSAFTDPVAVTDV